MIYLIRHGIAENFADSDFNRELTLEGRIKLYDDFKKFQLENNLETFKIKSSPYIRARQTAEILSRVLNKNFEIDDDLGFSGDYVKIIEKLSGDYILIGHEPMISDAIYRLVGNKIIVSKGSIHRVR